MKKRTITLMMAALMLAGTITGCGAKPAENSSDAKQPTESTADSSAAEAQSSERGNFVMCEYVGNVDPASSAYAWVGVRTGVMESLFVLDDNLQVQKNLVKDYSVSEDGLTWTIELRDDVKFQNGNPMDAEAVKASLLRVCELQSRADGELQIDHIDTDGFTLQIVTREPNPTLPNCLCDPYSGIVDASDLDAEGNALVGTGPFKLQEYITDERMELEAFDEYWQGVPASKHLTIVANSDLDAASMALQKGEVDACYGLSYDNRDIFTADSGFKISEAATSRVYKVYFNLEHEFTGDPEFRRALVMAMDKKAYSEILLNGAGTPTKSTFPSSAAFGDDSVMTNVPDYDMEGAKQLLSDNGYVDSDGDGFLDKDGKKVTLNIITYGRTGLPQCSQAIQSALTELGIDVSYEQLEGTNDRGAAGTYDLSVYAEVTLPTGDPYSYMMNNYKTGGVQNFCKISIPEVDELMEQLAVEFDVAKRNELTQKIDAAVLAENSICNMFHLNMYMAMKANVEGLNQSPVDYYHITYQTCVKD